MIPELILIALLVGWIAGGKFLRLADARIRYGWLIFVALGTYVAAWAVALNPVTAKLDWFSGASHMVEKLALLVMVIANIRIPGAKLILIGMALNFIALAANGGLMPAQPDALATAFGKGYIETARHSTHVRSAIMDTATNLGFLCDIVAARRPFVLLPAVYSIGDLIMSVGIFTAIIALMRKPLSKEC